MEVEDVIAQARDAMTIKRVFGEPYEKDGMTVIPVARVQGGAGAGGGEAPEGQGRGSGSGFAMNARPVGAYVIQDGAMTWKPAIDLTRIVLGGQLVAVVFFLTIRAIVRARSKAGK
ncbi:MAG TPA: spore germination protein GerW family protein [Acidimicrobiia bacterium]|nr:spore germination protein GerW family protein [Acidimicrobiia bacterium]